MALTWWRDLSVSKKLYSVVGVMGFLIALELLTLLFAMDTLSAVRAFIAGESYWATAQKNAVHSLHRYVFTANPKYYADFKRNLETPLNDHAALQELLKSNPDQEVILKAFTLAENHPQDVDSFVRLIRRFGEVPYVKRSLQIWTKSDEKIGDLIKGGEELKMMLSKKNRDDTRIQMALNRIDLVNDELTDLEKEFSVILGAGSRWLEGILFGILTLTVLMVEITGLFLIATFTRHLSRSLKELTATSHEVGRGNFNQVAPVRSGDELGQLAESLNKMSANLRESIGEKQQAESANQVKTMFLASMSHEIRTPVGVILGLSDVLKDENLSWEDHMKYVETIERTGKSLMQIINDILDISKVEAGHLHIEKTDFSLPEFMHEMQNMLQVQAEKTGNRLVFETTGIPSAEISTDRVRLRQILVNLVGNALKFTNKGTVAVKYGGIGGELVVRISDTGKGIPPHFREKLFRPFSQADQSATKQEGTGLGLVLSKRLANVLGGDLALEWTELGRGTTFLLTLPFEQKKPQVIARPAPELTREVPHGPTQYLKGARVLVAEDSLDNQMLLRLFLAKHGVNMTFVNNGQEAVDRVCQNPDDFDFVLMDIQMPIMDGYTATRTLRERGFRKPIIALTAHAMKEDRELCIEAGCSDYLTKPIDPKLLALRLSEILGQQTAATSTAQSTPAFSADL